MSGFIASIGDFGDWNAVFSFTTEALSALSF
jgi:hypothetical protein